MSVGSRKLLHGGQSPQGLLGKFRDRQKAELASYLAGVQKEPKISGRNACRNGRGFLLHIIRDQPVVLRGTEFGEVSPGAERRAAEKRLVLIRGFVDRVRRQVQPHRNPFT